MTGKEAGWEYGEGGRKVRRGVKGSVAAAMGSRGRGRGREAGVRGREEGLGASMTSSAHAQPPEHTISARPMCSYERRKPIHSAACRSPLSPPTSKASEMEAPAVVATYLGLGRVGGIWELFALRHGV